MKLDKHLKTIEDIIGDNHLSTSEDTRLNCILKKLKLLKKG